VTALLEVQGVTVRFGGLVALSDVSAEVGTGEVVGVIGPNGAGKTTLFNVVCGFTRPAEGDLSWQGRPLRHHQPRHLAGLGIARTLQSLGLFPHLNVVENVMVGAGRHSRAGVGSALFALPRGDRDEQALRTRAFDMLDSLGVADMAERLPGQLPYGVQKRVALARALVAEPRLLLLDEPASGLSAEEMRELGELIRGLRGRMSVLLVEHHMDLVMEVCDRIVVLDFGRVIATGTPDEVRGDPRVLDAYLGEQVDDDTGEVSDARG
jgi:branched-chain amino acid transport system ATP-binding protein